jgi:hypothetical protein
VNRRTGERVYRQIARIKAQPQYIPWPPTFYQFLAYHRVMPGPLGKVARFAVLDVNCWPIKGRSKDAIWRHVLTKHPEKPFDEFAMHEAFRLYYEFLASKKQIPSRNVPEGDYYILRYISLSQEAFTMLERLMNPEERPEECNEPSPVVEQAVRALHEILFGEPQGRTDSTIDAILEKSKSGRLHTAAKPSSVSMTNMPYCNNTL